MYEPGKKTDPPKRPLIFYYAVMLLAVLLLNWLFVPMYAQRQVHEVTYDTFLSMVDEGRVKTVAYDREDSQIVFEGTDENGKEAVYKTGIFPDDGLYERLDEANVQFAAEIPQQTSPLLSLLVSYAPVSYTHLDVYKRQETCRMYRGWLFAVRRRLTEEI